MHRSITLPIAILGAVLSTGCSAAMRGPDTCAEIHFDATYVLARWAGWPERDARAIASADFWTDRHEATTSVATERRVVAGIVNPLTVPWVVCASVGDMVIEGDAPSRAIGKRVAEATAWAVPSMGHRLHFPAIGLRTAVLPAFYVNPASGEIEYGSAEARRVLERAFLYLQSRDEDEGAILALLGMGLHSLQDSFKHCGYSATQGHIGIPNDPDRPCCNLGTTMLSAEVTLNSLRYARRLATGRSTAPPKGWREKLRAVFAEATPLGGDPSVRWARFVKETFGEEYGSRYAVLETWKGEDGELGFGRAVDRARTALEETEILD
jgi:hypothetical protein